ncbi:MAG: translocation/assembly module TamB domain-containing protein, partial [bacterium]|nr:translocation/assembly module TamB domain-containing protein [bacterium]
NFVRERLESMLSESIDGSCHISEIKGKWNYFSIRGVEVRSEKVDSDIFTGEIDIDLPALLFRKVKVGRLFLDSVCVFIKKSDSSNSAAESTALGTDNTIAEAVKAVPFSISAREISLRRINLYYDTLYAKNISLNAVVSFNRKKGYLLYRIENCDLMGIVNLKKTNGEIFLKSDSLSHDGILSCEFFTFENSIGYKDDSLFINKGSFQFHSNKQRLFKTNVTALGKAELEGQIIEGLPQVRFRLDLSKAGADTFLFDKISLSAEMKKDTVWVRRAEVNDSLCVAYLSGFIETGNSLGGEFDIFLTKINLGKFIKGTNLADNGIAGVMHFKTDFRESFTLIVDSLNGHYGNLANIKLKGSSSYVNREFSVKNGLLQIDDGSMSVNGSIAKERGQVEMKISDFSLEALSFLKRDLSLSGHLNGEVNLSGGIKDYKCAYSLEMTNGFFEKNTFEYFSSSGTLYGRENKLNRGVIQGSFVNGNIFGKNVSIIYFESKKENENLYFDIDGVSEILSFGASGRFSLSEDYSSGTGMIDRLNIKTDFDTYSLDKSIEMKFGKNLFAVDSFSISGNSGFLKAGFKTTRDSLIFKLDGYDKNLTITGYATGVNIKGDARIFAEGEGKKDSLLMKLSGFIKDAEFEGIKADSVFINCDYDGDNLDVNYLNVFHEDKLSYLFGKLMIDEDSLENSMMELSFDIQNVDETFFLPLENIFTVKTKTGLEGKGRIYGKITQPLLEGTITVDSADVFIVSLGTTVKRAKGYAILSGDSAVVKELRGKTERGDLLLTGGVSLDGYMMEEYWFKILADGAHSTGIDYVDVFANCSLDIRGDMKKVDMNGLIKITEGVSNFPFIASSENSQPSGESEYQSNMDLRLVSDNNLWLKNSIVDAELRGDIFLRKQGYKWNVTGKANVIRGYYFYLDKKFKITGGVFDLKETSKIVEPVIEIYSNTRIQYVDGDEKKQADVFLEATGSAFKPNVSLYSEPAMGIENIISILSFNTTLSSLSNFEEISKGVPEKALQIYLRNKYLNTISSSIGVDQLDIQTNLLGSEKSAKLSVGKYIGRRIYVSYTHDVFTFEKDVFRIEYNVIKNTDIITERDEQGYFNTGLQFKYRF